MRTPEFWKHRGVMSYLLQPLSLLYRFGAFLRQKTAPSPEILDAPVICVGNIIAGGSGKTPVAIAIGKYLQENGLKPAFITRGYKAAITTSCQVDRTKHTAADVGDEALLLAAIAPCWIGKQRIASARAAIAAGHNILVFDDGLQNPRFHKDCRIVVIDGSIGHGNQCLIPAGPCRIRPEALYPDIDAIVMIGDDQHGLIRSFPSTVPLIKATVQPSRLPDTSVPYIAFAGIGYPEKFFDTLRHHGFSLLETFPFPDHHNYHPNDIKKLQDLSATHHCSLITTEKDAVRLPADLRKNLATLPIDLLWNQTNQLDELLRDYGKKESHIQP